MWRREIYWTEILVEFCQSTSGAMDGKPGGGVKVRRNNLGCEKKRNRRRVSWGGVLRKGFCF